MNMNWQSLLSHTRLGREQDTPGEDSRTEYIKDWDRLVYSSAFRRLQDKTQVFPLADSDYIRTRLTHSIEVSSVGRSLGMLCGRIIAGKEPGLKISEHDIGSIVAAACLAHDIGNPPFGHSGEGAIQGWFKEAGRCYLEKIDAKQRNDFLLFEGNAQGFRLITRLQNAHNLGGFQLTYAVLAAFGKYPRPSVLDTTGNISEKKFGYCVDDAENFQKVARGVGLIEKGNGAYCRHPLAFLMEAADDICYHVVDLEDGHRLGRVSFDQAFSLLSPLAFPDGEIGSDSYHRIRDNAGRIEYLRARAIGSLIKDAVNVFRDCYGEIMSGSMEKDLIGQGAFSAELKKIREISRASIYSTPAVLQIEIAGFEILSGLLGKIVPALFAEEGHRTMLERKIAEIVPDQFKQGATPYTRLLGATDYVSGMTDTFALSMFRRLHGMELPGAFI